MTTTEDPTVAAELAAWSWRGELAEQERSIAWLGRRTGIPTRTIYSYAYGQRRVTQRFLRAAAVALGRHDLLQRGGSDARESSE
jgi:hypothetical protein